MAKTYRMNAFRRAVNVVMSYLARKGKGPASELTTVGRTSGKERTVPVTPVTVGGTRYLVSPYGTVGWVYNIRASGTATLSRGGGDETITVTEVRGEEAAKVLKAYLDEVGKVVEPFFDATAEATVDDLLTEADRHPVFRID